MQIDVDALERSLQGLRERAEGGALVEALDLCVHTAVRLFAVTGASLLLIDDAMDLRVVAATDAPGRALDELQAETGEGPCVDALRNDRVVVVEDVATDERWPGLHALAGAGVHAVVGAPVHLAGAAVGSVNVYRDTPHVWSDRSGPALEAYAAVVEGVVANALRSRQQSAIADQLRASLQDRVTIERAVGLVMGRDHVDAVTAFNRLRRSARDGRRPVVEVAAGMLHAAIPQRSG